MIHVLPINDLRQHQLDTTCDCMPIIEYVEGCMILTHSSFDEREFQEWDAKAAATDKKWQIVLS